MEPRFPIFTERLEGARFLHDGICLEFRAKHCQSDRLIGQILLLANLRYPLKAPAMPLLL